MLVDGGVLEPDQGLPLVLEALQDVKVVPLGEFQERVVVLAFDGTELGLARTTRETAGVVTFTVTLSDPEPLAPVQVRV